MPRGRGRGGSGGGRGARRGGYRNFTDAEELERQWKEHKAGGESNGEDRFRQRREKQKQGSDSEEDSSSSSSEEEDESGAKKGVQGLIQIENPNHVKSKMKKITQLDEAKPELSRREKEEIERIRKKEEYDRLHAAGKTEEAQADLARLAIVRKQREEAAQRREAEKANKDEVARQRKVELEAKAMAQASRPGASGSRSARNKKKKAEQAAAAAAAKTSAAQTGGDTGGDS